MMVMMMMMILFGVRDVVGVHGKRLEPRLTRIWWTRHSRTPPVRTPVTQRTHANSTLLVLGLLGRRLSLLLLIKQEGFGIEVRQRCVSFQYFSLGGFSLR